MGLEKPVVVFCDFDGTITQEDLIVTVWRTFGPLGWEKQVEDILSRRKNLRDGVAEIFGQIAASQCEEIIQHAAKAVRFRTGFRELLDYCHKRNMTFVVASGSLDFFLDPILEEFRTLIHRVYSISTDLSGEKIRLLHPLGCETCGLCKARVMGNYPGTFRVFIGDGLTDVHGALQSDLVFARSQLAQVLEEEDRKYLPYETFFDVIDGISRTIHQTDSSLGGVGYGS